MQYISDGLYICVCVEMDLQFRYLSGKGRGTMRFTGGILLSVGQNEGAHSSKTKLLGRRQQRKTSRQ